MYHYIDTYCGDNPNRMICLRWFTTMNQRSVFSSWRPFSLQPIHTQSSAQGAETRPAPGDAGYAHGDPSRRYLGAGGIWSAKMGRKASDKDSTQNRTLIKMVISIISLLQMAKTREKMNLTSQSIWAANFCPRRTSNLTSKNKHLPLVIYPWHWRIPVFKRIIIH